MTVARPAPELDAEQEIDFGRYWRAIAARWWIVVAGLVVGLIIGYAVSVGTRSSSYEATAQVYLGQPLAPQSATDITNAPTTLGLVSNFVKSEAIVRRVAARIGVKPSALRGRIEAKPVSGITNAKAGTPAPLMDLTVTGLSSRKVAEAANEVARQVVREVSSYTQQKIRTLNDTPTLDRSQLEAVNARILTTIKQQEQVLSQNGLDSASKLIASVNYNNLLQFLDSRRSGLEHAMLDINTSLALANDIEAPRVVAAAAATKASATSARVGAAVGGLIGLIVGIIVAIVWDPIAERRRAAS
jgi:capsular polysaccharide biosynthesis protein